MSVCPYCSGRGCVECDDTGRRYRIAREIDGVTFNVSGSGPEPSRETQAAFEEVARAVADKLREGQS